MSEWHKYRIGELSTNPKWVNQNCQKIWAVGHASHVDPALAIVRNDGIRPSLVFDESKLNTSRILVVWLSPNHWSPGYRYGGIRFDFDFRTLVQGKNYYWVEAITAYNPPACRILITDQDRSGILQTYDPTLRDGPWWFDQTTGTDYYNGNYCLEFMVENEVLLSELTCLKFVDHHPQYCSIHRLTPKNCRELGMPGGRSGARFLLRAAVSNTSLARVSPKLLDDDGSFSSDLFSAFDHILNAVRKKVKFFGTMKEKGEIEIAMCRASINADVHGYPQEALRLAGMFPSEEALLNAVARIIANSLDIEDAAGIYKRPYQQ